MARFAGGYDRDGWRGRGAYDRDLDRYPGGGRRRWQTDYGDPFGDRAAGTPFRVVWRGGRSSYDRPLRPLYDRDLRAGPDRPPPPPADGWGGGPWSRGYGRSYQTRGRSGMGKRGGYDPFW